MTLSIDDFRGRLNLGAVAVVGAGLSLSVRYPDTKNLTTLVWDAVDSDPAARAGLATRVGHPDAPAKTLIGDDQNKLDEAWVTIAATPAMRRRFQQAFVALDASRADQPSPSQEALAQLIHAGLVEYLVSLNWDSALEAAYRRLYGTSIPTGILAKPHGDVAHPDEPWVLPHQDGVVSPEIVEKVTSLAEEHPRTLLVVGYSESDPTVVQELIAPLEERWRVTRVSPLASRGDDVAGTAADVLSELAKPIVNREEESAWHVITFSSQRGIEPALVGERLGPMDVEACPRLPVVESVRESLLRSHSVVINGDSGSGKSITAYQVASDLAAGGYEILRLRDRARHDGIRSWLNDRQYFPRPKLLFIDDAQDLSADTVRELAETATADQLVLIAGVDHVAGGVATHVVSGVATVGILNRFVLEHRDDLLHKVRKLDNRVGDGLGDERFEVRVEQAATKTNAWLFFYTLTGGWRRTVRKVQDIRDRDRADLAACALAIAQVASVDSGVTIDDLVPYAEAIGRDRGWVEKSLQVLRSNLLAFEQDGIWRCPHLRTAFAIIDWMFHPPYWDLPVSKPPVRVGPIASATSTSVTAKDDPLPSPPAPPRTPPLPDAVIKDDRANASTLLQAALDAPATSMRAAAWLLGRNLSYETRNTMRQIGVRSPERDRALATRALATPPGPDVTMAAQLLEHIHGPDAPEVVETIWDHLDAVVGWVQHMTPETGWAVATLVNVLINEDRIRIASALAGTDATKLADLITAGGWPHIYSTTDAVDRVAQAGGVELIRAVGQALDEEALGRMLDTVPSLSSANQLLDLLCHTNPELGLRLFESHAAQLAAAFSRNPLEEFHGMFDTFGFLLGYAPGFLRPHPPTTDQRRAARAFLQAMDTRRLVAELTKPKYDWRWHNFWEFLSMFLDADPTGWAKVAEAVDLDALEETLTAQAQLPSNHLLFVLNMLAHNRHAEVRAMLDRHEDQVEHLSAFNVYIHPELAIRLLKRGLPLDLGLEHQHYDEAATLLTIISKLDADTAREVADANADAFVAGLAANHSQPFKSLTTWVKACDTTAPHLIDTVLASLDEGVVLGWSNALRDSESKRHDGQRTGRHRGRGTHQTVS